MYKPAKDDYEKALEFYRNGAVRNISAREGDGSYPEKELSYSARVEDSEKGDQTVVTITLGKDGIKYISCTRINSWYYSSSVLRPECRIFSADRTGTYQLCVHKTAALLSLFDFLHENRDYIDFSDKAAVDFINNFHKTTPKKKKSAADTSDIPVDIEPTLLWSSGVLTLRVSGAKGRLYKVHDVGKLISGITQKDVYNITKENAIDFSKAHLTERAERIMKVAQSAQLQNLVHKYTSTGDRDYLYICWVYDEFFSSLEDGDVLLPAVKN